jgi:hypothetical protein
MSARNIVISTVRCAKTAKWAAIRFERAGDSVWTATWCFAIKESSAKREGYETTKMDGRFGMSPEFPGCPECGAKQFFLCSCGKLACWNGEERRVTCPWCRQSGELAGEITSISGGTDT